MMKLGAVVVPLNTRFKGEELAYEINDSESKILIVDEEYWPFISSVRDRLTSIKKIFFNGHRVPKRTLPFSSLMKTQEAKFTQTTLTESDEAAILYTSVLPGNLRGPCSINGA